jgi:hypothetical protein
LLLYAIQESLPAAGWSTAGAKYPDILTVLITIYTNESVNGGQKRFEILAGRIRNGSI